MISLAEMIGISRVSLSGIATGKQKPSFDTLEKIAAALDVEVGELFAPKAQNELRCPHCGKTIHIRFE